MAHVKRDRVQELSASSGTGAMVLAGAPARMLTFASRLSDGDTCRVLIEHTEADEFEICVATYSAGTLTRGTLIESTTGARVSFSAGTKVVSIVTTAGDATDRPLREITSGTATTLDPDDRNVSVNKASGAAHAITLDAPGIPSREVMVVDGKGDAGTYNITVSGHIHGSANYATISTNRGWLRLLDTGSTYLIIG